MSSGTQPKRSSASLLELARSHSSSGTILTDIVVVEDKVKALANTAWDWGVHACVLTISSFPRQA